MNTLLIILTLLGAIGLFMFGMRIMSEALQKVAGFGLRKNLAAITRNKLKGILTGSVVTAAIQSSSAVTIMIVSFVNAGLLSLSESAGLVIGANIGTTITAWIIALLGFKVSISAFTLPLIGVSLPIFFSKRKQLRYWGEFIMGFALIFIGLEFIKNVFPTIQNHPEVLSFVKELTHYGIASVFIFLFTGLIITSVIQSSSVATALTIVMCYKGWIDFEHAAAMILGENIGTTITANIAAVVANKPAKRIALFHTLFNVLGLFWAIPLFNPFIYLVNEIITETIGLSPLVNIEIVPVSLAVFHSVFNIFNTLVVIKFTPQLIYLTEKLIRITETEKESFKLKFIHTGMLSTSELSLVQVKNELHLFGKKAYKMFQHLKNLFVEINDSRFQNIYKEIKEFEDYSDQLEQEINLYLTSISEGEISQETSYRIRIMIKISDELESICDSIYNLAKVLRKRKKQKIWFTQDIRNNLNHMFALLEKAFIEMTDNLEKEYKNVTLKYASCFEKEINKYRKVLYKTHLNKPENTEYRFEAGVMYNDIFNRLERLGDYVYNVTKSLSEIRNDQE